MEPELTRPNRSYIDRLPEETDEAFEKRTLTDIARWRETHQRISETGRRMRSEQGPYTSVSGVPTSEEYKARNREAARRNRERQAARTADLIKSNQGLREELAALKDSMDPKDHTEIMNDLRRNKLLRQEVESLRATTERQATTIHRQAELLNIHLHLARSCYICRCRLFGWALNVPAAAAVSAAVSSTVGPTTTSSTTTSETAAPTATAPDPATPGPSSAAGPSALTPTSGATSGGAVWI